MVNRVKLLREGSSDVSGQVTSSTTGSIDNRGTGGEGTGGDTPFALSTVLLAISPVRGVYGGHESLVTRVDDAGGLHLSVLSTCPAVHAS